MTRPERPGHSHGFTLVESVVLVAVLGILAGLTAPLALKTLNQKRVAATRKDLKRAFEAMFGAHDRRVANMRADFGFDPARSYPALPFLVRPCWGQVPAYGPHDDASFCWGYNGPYWLGPVQAGNPVDAWGSPLQLRHDPVAGTWQLRSLGPDKLESGDDLCHPPTPASVGSFEACLLVTVLRVSPDLAGSVTLRRGGDTGAHLVESTLPLQPRAPCQSLRFRVPAGTLELRFSPSQQGFAPFTVPLDLLPGQTRELEVRL